MYYNILNEFNLIIICKKWFGLFECICNLCFDNCIWFKNDMIKLI